MKYRIFLWILVVLGIGVWLIGVNDPYVGSYNANNNYLALASRNYLRFGMERLHFLPTYYAGNPSGGPDDYYLHHPFLFFLVNVPAFFVFGFGNWVSHVMTFVFTLGSVAMMGVLVGKWWGKKAGILTSVAAVLLPATAMFWKYMFFEQPTTCLNLMTLYCFFSYMESGNRRMLFLAMVSSALSIMMDWYGGYVIVPLLVAFWFGRFDRKRFLGFFLAHAAVVFAGIAAFLWIVAVAKGGFTDVVNAVSVRSVTNELFGLSYWPVRYVGLNLLRILIYFGVFGCIGLGWIVKKTADTGEEKSRRAIMASLLVLAVEHFIVLPTACWGHTYFLWTFIPPVAAAIGIMLSGVRKKSAVLAVLTVMLFWSAIVTWEKRQQAAKQYWKFGIAETVDRLLAPYETVGVTDFPGDVFENSFFHPSDPIADEQLDTWLDKTWHPRTNKLVYVCKGDCGEADRNRVASVSARIAVTEISVPGGEAWIFDRTREGNAISASPSAEAPSGNGSVARRIPAYLRWYRTFRDIFHVVQI